MSSKIIADLDRAIQDAEARATQRPDDALAREYIRGLRTARQIVITHMDDWFNRKLTRRIDYVDIKARAARGEKQADLAREYGVSPSLVSRIVKGERT